MIDQSIKKTVGNKNIVFNYLPPAAETSPSAAFSVLKGFLKKHNYDSTTIYWNILIHDMLKSILPFQGISPDEFDILLLIPFLIGISEKYKSSQAMERILSKFYSMFPKYSMKSIPTGTDIIEHIKNSIHKLIDNELDKIDVKNTLLVGFSAKFHQWIPGIILAEKLKKRFPNIKIAIGGFGSSKDAKALLNVCHDFDFAVWGEGEYPLLELLKQIDIHAYNCHLAAVPNLAYRENSEIKVTKVKSRFLDFNEYMSPDFSDYLNSAGIEGNNQFRFTIETSRGCHWNRCKFCYLNVGYRYRRRPPEHIVREVESLSSKYDHNRFLIVDNDAVGTDTDYFEKLLDLLIESARKNQVIYDFQAEIVHRGFNSRIIKKMATAGFNRVQIGYEAITDSLLKKIDKKTDFSDLILFAKFASKYGITVIGSNIIRGIVGETPADVQESIKNLPFLRFFLNSHPGRSNIWHILIKLRLEPGSIFFKMVNEAEKQNWNFHPTAYLLPDSFITRNDRSQLFGFFRQLENEVEWDQFKKANKFYQDTDFKYSLYEHSGFKYYSEYMQEDMINYIIFNEPEYWDVLKAANEEVISFERIFNKLKRKYTEFTEQRLMEIVEQLKSDYLLYANKELTRIVSIIDTQ